MLKRILKEKCEATGIGLLGLEFAGSQWRVSITSIYHKHILGWEIKI